MVAVASPPAQSVVVVEDETELAHLYADALQDNYTVDIATDGEEALSVIDHETDVVVLDRRLPKRHGDEVLTEIRAQQYGCRVIVVTAVDPGLDVAGMPFEAYLTKPVSTEELRNAVDEQSLYATYDDKVQEYTRLRSQIELLRSEEPDWVLRDSDEFEQLCASADAVRADIEELFEGHEQAVTIDG